MPLVTIEEIRNEMIDRSKAQLERSISAYERLFRTDNNLTVEQNIISTSTELNKLNKNEIQDWYIDVLNIDLGIHFCSLTDKSYNHKVMHFSRYDWLGLDKTRLENLMFLLSNTDTISSVDTTSIKLLSSQLQSCVPDKRDGIYRVIRILIIAYNLELYNCILSLANYLYIQIHVNTLK